MYSCFGANIRGRRAKDGLNAPPYTEVQIPWALCIVEDDGDPRSASGWQPKVNGLIGGRKRRPLDLVAGYCIGLDMTMRGSEERSLRKSLDTFTVLGPWMVTADEFTW